MRYPDCECTNGCAACSLSNYGRDCRNSPINRLAFLRTSAGMTQIELAEKSGKMQQWIWKIENDKIDLMNTSGKNLLALAQALGVSIETLLTDE